MALTVTKNTDFKGSQDPNLLSRKKVRKLNLNKTRYGLQRAWNLKIDKEIIKRMVALHMHFGHLTRHRNPKMSPYIRGVQKGKHFINLVESLFLLEQVSQFLEQKAAQGKKFLFVGTEKQSAFLIEKIALLSNSFFVNEKWLGGLLTNWKTMKSSVNQLQYLERFNTSTYIQSLPKKKAILYKKQKERLEKYFRGLKKMVKKPDIVVIVGQRKESNAVRECKKLNIATITVLDTNCNPTLADFFIPANDDSYGSLDFLFRAFLKAIRKGRIEYSRLLPVKK